MEYASKGTADAGLTTGIIGTALGALNSGLFNGGLGGLFSGGNAAADLSGMATGAALAAALGVGGRCSEDKTVSRYELGLQQQIAEKDAQIALRDANTYGDQKMSEMYKYVDGQLKDIRGALCAQSVHNQKTEDSFTVAMNDLAAVKEELRREIQIEAERRCCGDNAIVTYANATFYPKQVADVTTGTATTPQTLYNPLPNCGKL
nr:MAG TPA: hypothetical protein [Caudoviricetes sp.]